MGTRAFADQQTQDRNINFAQQGLAQALRPLLSNPITNGSILESVDLINGDTTIDHKLNRELQGWLVVRQRADADIYDKQDSNSRKDVTLVLTSSAAVTVDIYVF